MSDRLSNFGKSLKAARKKRGLKTQQKFVEELENYGFPITLATVRNWEQGKTYPEMTTLNILCDFFDCDMDYLFGRISCKTHDIQFIHDYTGLDESAIEVLKELKKSQVAIDVLNFLISDGELLSKIKKYFCSFTSDELLQEPYCYLPLDGPVPDYRLRLAEISELLPENRKRFVDKYDETQKQTIVFDYVKDFLDYYGCDRILSGSAVMFSALLQGANGMRNQNRIKDIPDKDDLEQMDDFERILTQSQIALLPIQQKVIKDCLDSIGVDIIKKMASQVSTIRKLSAAFNSEIKSEVSDDGAD